MIRMYREFQMQAVGFAVLLYTAVLALVGSTLDSARLVDVLSNYTALLSYLAAIVVLAYAVMEIRIQRASLYIWRTLSPKLLVAASLVACRISIRHEGREEPEPPPEAAAA